MTPEMQCSSCQYWDDPWCKRYPPQNIVFRPKLFPWQRGVGESTWPKTHDDMWCGEWSAVAAKERGE